MIATRPTGSDGSVGDFDGYVALKMIKHGNTDKLNKCIYDKSNWREIMWKYVWYFMLSPIKIMDIYEAFWAYCLRWNLLS